MLKLIDIVKNYDAGGQQVPALRGVSINFRESEFVAILGQSGCGKTTLLNIIGGLDQYTSGDLVINGRSTRDYSDSDWDTYRNHSIGFVFQSYNLIPHQSVLSNVELALTLSGVSKSERRRRAEEALERVGLKDQMRKRPNQMSGGQMQRVAIARALVNSPDILLADEPTGALDSETSLQIMEILKEIAKNKLVIMVTHNPELAERYATRTIRLLDGHVIDDTMPLTETECNEKRKAADAAGKKTSMSFGTALGLSLNNLMTKKTRTFLTAFAGSIGIIGIALIMSLSNGIQTYIDRVQEDTLSSYPLTIEAETVSMSDMLETLMGVHEEEESAHEDGKVYSNTIMYDLTNSMLTAGTETNNLEAFRAYIEDESNGFYDYASAIQYEYGDGLNIFTEDVDGKIIRSDAMSVLEDAMEAMGNTNTAFSSAYNSYSGGVKTWEQMLPGEDGTPVNDILLNQYDLLYGKWPERYDEVVLIVSENNELSDLMLYSLGLKSTESFSDEMEKFMAGETVDAEAESWSYEELCDKHYRLLLPAEQYEYDKNSETYTDLTASDAGLDYLYHSDSVGLDLKIVGILRANKDAAASMMNGAVAYTSALTDYIIKKTAEQEIIQKQKDDPETDVINGLPFATGDEEEPTAEEKTDAIKEHVETLSTAEKAEIYTKTLSTPTEEYVEDAVETYTEDMTREYIETMLLESYAEEIGISSDTMRSYVEDMDDETLFSYVHDGVADMVREQYAAGVEAQLARYSAAQLAAMLDNGMKLEEEQYVWMYDNYMPATLSDSTYEENLKLLGDMDAACPSAINIYASTFADKDAISDLISAYNDGAAEEDQITYTDYVALLMSSITSIINAISYVLIAFVAISLVVSSIMIGIITYISVLERTKEIGILRAIGASKRDISRVFNAETLIEGLASGLLGIGVTLLLIIPINAIIHRLTDIMSLNAVLPAAGGAALVVISMVLTFIAGLIPSGIAARKDPVVALRTE